MADRAIPRLRAEPAHLWRAAAAKELGFEAQRASLAELRAFPNEKT
jgi:hypothetical protein